MNAPVRLFMNARQSRMAARLLACVGAAALTSGCVGNPLADAKIDPASPIAGEVAKLAHSNSDYPSFSEIPAKPTDVRPARMYGQAARDVEQARAQIERATAPETWTLNNTETFAATARAAAGRDIAPAKAADTEVFADTLRKRATPPPPPNR
jgi:hypothetical protein